MVADAHPSPRVLRIINPIFRTLLRSPLARFAPEGLVVLEFKGRRTGRVYRIVVACHRIDGEWLVFSPADWVVNFRAGADVAVIRGSRRRRGRGQLVSDPEAVAPKL